MRLKGKKLAKTISLLIALTMFLSFPTASFGSSDGSDIEAINQRIEQTGAYLMKAIETPGFGMVGGDWTLLGLVRSVIKLPQGYADSYYKNVEATLKQKEGNLTQNKYSEYSRLILALTAIGKDPTDAAGYDLIAKLADLELVKRQGINGPIYALIALDSLDYTIPQNTEASIQTTRENLIASILEKELPAGGFALSGSVADPDVTAAALQALSNYSDRADVKTVIDRALAFLSSAQTNNGGFTGWAAEGIENTESIAQVILALTSLGIDPVKDNRFIKTDEKGQKRSPLDALEAFRLKDGSYRHIPGGDSDLMPTEQALLALVSYQRLLAGESPIFRMKDVGANGGSGGANEGANYEYKVLLNGRYLTFDQPPINRNGRVLVPMRAIFEALGADVDWDNNLRRAIGTLGARQVQLTIDSKTAYINGEPVELDVPAVIENSRTLVPVRVVSEGLDAKVDWDGITNTVIIVKE